ncbi:LysR family transcriptional regulator [Lachnoclostridium phytofermentans]|uniref:Transcriptional regulator, LysR family n=1 Tax=Lachnoclostridium phytofermentans (strain ATCC 700394 / DSM 18823 / ISDg) TaxID=357809 RepID=A9KLP8_LACP7|nr:LysR family transcriptional regulator [Lachnoclostridium phytofermentans]ABX42792.1 transcriptional regulator, LysR family [Lachnoclostridium phytofermentans ISDg]
MDLKQLQYFVTVVEEGNISKAAAKLHLTQPPLSTQLKCLENELSVTLFERGSRKIELTQEGKILYARAQSILELTELSKKELLDYSCGSLGTLHIGIVSSVVDSFLYNLMPDFHKQYKEIRYDLFEGNTYEQIQKLRNNLIELAIVRTPYQAEDLSTLVLKKESMMAFGHKRYFQQMDIKSLLQQPLILYRRWEKIIYDLCHSYSITPNIFCMNDDARTTVSLANEGYGIGIIPESAGLIIARSMTKEEQLSKEKLLTCLELKEARLDSDICLLYKPNGYISKAGNLFIQYLKEKSSTL